MKLICTNNVDAFNYWQLKGVKCVIYNKPIKEDNVLNIFFPKMHNCSLCGNRYNRQRIESGLMRKEFEELKELIETPNCIVITNMLLYNGKLHAQLYPESMSNVKRQRIHTSRLGELVYPHFIHIYGAELEPVTDIEPVRDYVYYDPDKREDTLYYNVFYVKASKEERRKKRYTPEYALFSQLYKQVIKEDK